MLSVGLGDSAIDPDLPPGATLARNVILHPIGVGRRSVVYAAYDFALGRKVAVKWFNRSERQPGESDAIYQAARAMAQLAHAHIVRIHDVGAFEGCVYVAMEYVEQTLEEWLSQATRSW